MPKKPSLKQTPPRIQIQDVRPQVDCGRYPVKATQGETVPVSATIFKDGHDILRAVVRYRHDVGAERIYCTVPCARCGWITFPCSLATFANWRYLSHTGSMS